MYQQMLMMQQQMLQMAQVIDAQNGTNMSEQMAAGITGGAVPAQTMAAEATKIDNTEALGGDATGEAANTKKARQRVAESTSPT